MIAERVQSFFSDLAKKSIHGSVLIVTHAVTMRLIQAVLENSLPEYPREIPKNGEIWTTDFLRLGCSHELQSLFVVDSAIHQE